METPCSREPTLSSQSAEISWRTRPPLASRCARAGARTASPRLPAPPCSPSRRRSSPSPSSALRTQRTERGGGTEGNVQRRIAYGRFAISVLHRFMTMRWSSLSHQGGAVPSDARCDCQARDGNEGILRHRHVRHEIPSVLLLQGLLPLIPAVPTASAPAGPLVAVAVRVPQQRHIWLFVFGDFHLGRLQDVLELLRLPLDETLRVLL
mmetsp:Transcript_9448/g.41385  ORF Transcript_9448/g.41385 Transcript_9448/m.41385 type:complete len:208 (-) Transcript_9448:699-1322(-)